MSASQSVPGKARALLLSTQGPTRGRHSGRPLSLPDRWPSIRNRSGRAGRRSVPGFGKAGPRSAAAAAEGSGASPSSSKDAPKSRRTSHADGPRPASSSSSSLSLTDGNGSGRRGSGGCRMLTSPTASGHSTALICVLAARTPIGGEADSGAL